MQPAVSLDQELSEECEQRTFHFDFGYRKSHLIPCNTYRIQGSIFSVNPYFGYVIMEKKGSGWGWEKRGGVGHECSS
jgi:hypothetical protein